MSKLNSESLEDLYSERDHIKDYIYGITDEFISYQKMYKKIKRKSCEYLDNILSKIKEKENNEYNNE